MPVSFTYASINDLEKIVATYNSTIASRLVTADLEPVSLESKIEWFHQHNPTNRPLWTIQVDDRYVGWMSFNSFYGRPAYDETVEVSIYLDENVRGKGIGKACLTKAFESCKDLKIKTLLGFIFDHNEPSLQLFYKMGFEKWAHLPRIAKMGDVDRGLIIVGKRVIE